MDDFDASRTSEIHNKSVNVQQRSSELVPTKTIKQQAQDVLSSVKPNNTLFGYQELDRTVQTKAEHHVGSSQNIPANPGNDINMKDDGTGAAGMNSKNQLSHEKNLNLRKQMLMNGGLNSGRH